MQDAGGNPRAADRLIPAPFESQAEPTTAPACNRTRRAGRFAPTPSGALHQGSLIAALASRCDALANGYAWHLRIDDIDPPRVRKGSVDGIMRTLKACGFAWDGDPLLQSLHTKQYQRALATLIRNGRVFPCCCTRRQCGPDGRCISGCRDRPLPSDLLSQPPVDHAHPGDAAFSLRLCVLEPSSGNHSGNSSTRFDDRICGEQVFEPARCLGDIVLRRRDGPWSYALACAVDDSDGITDVVRGADLLHATFAQRLIIEFLGRTCPQYAHVPIAQDAQGRKLGKQTSAPPIDAAQALPSLMQAWHFLGQTFSSTHPPSTLQDFWQLAANDWSIARVPGTASTPADPGTAHNGAGTGAPNGND